MTHVAAERLAQAFHDSYEKLAPSFGYKTREASATPWTHVPPDNRNLMIAVAAELLATTLAPARTGVPMGGATAHTYYRRPRRVEAYLFTDTEEDAAELKALLTRHEGGGATFEFFDENGEFVMTEGIDPGYWLCVRDTGETYLVDDAEFRRDYDAAARV